MKELILSKDNSIAPNGSIGIQKCGIIFWQKTGFLRHCNKLGFQSIITLIKKKFSPADIQMQDDSCFLRFDSNNNKTIYLTLKREHNSNNCYIYGESWTVYAGYEFHIFALNVVRFIAKNIGSRFFVDDATNYLEHQSVDKLKEYIQNYIDNLQIPESPDLLRQAVLKNQKEQ